MLRLAVLSASIPDVGTPISSNPGSLSRAVKSSGVRNVAEPTVAEIVSVSTGPALNDERHRLPSRAAKVVLIDQRQRSQRPHLNDGSRGAGAACRFEQVRHEDRSGADADLPIGVTGRTAPGRVRCGWWVPAVDRYVLRAVAVRWSGDRTRSRRLGVRGCSRWRVPCSSRSGGSRASGRISPPWSRRSGVDAQTILEHAFVERFAVDDGRGTAPARVSAEPGRRRLACPRRRGRGR